jgi:hypothetical protein
MFKKSSSRRGTPVDTTVPGYVSPTDTTNLGQTPGKLQVLRPGPIARTPGSQGILPAPSGTPTTAQQAPELRSVSPRASQQQQLARADPDPSSASESSSQETTARATAGGVALSSRKPSSSQALSAAESVEARPQGKLTKRQEDVASLARKRSRDPKARSMGSALPVADLRRLMEQEKQAWKREESKAVGDPGADDADATIKFYRDRYAANFKTGRERDFFCRRFDECVAEWRTSAKADDDLEAALKGFNRGIRKELAEPRPATGLPSDGREQAQATSASTTELLPSPRKRRFEEYGFAESEKRKKEEIEKFGGMLKEFMEQAECAEDFRDDEFREAYTRAAWKQFHSIAMQDARLALRVLFEEEILRHFIGSFSLSGSSQAGPSSHPHIRQLESALKIWRAQPRSSKEMLTSEVLYAIWGRLERDRAVVVNFKAKLSAEDKEAQASFSALDAAIDRWRLDQANFSKPLNGRALAAIWQGLALQASGTVSPRGEQPKEKETPQKRERKMIEARCADFIGKPENPHFRNPAFKRDFLESVAGRRNQIGLAAFQPENLQKAYTGVQIALYWKPRAEAGWPDPARQQLERLIQAKCEALGNHVASEEQFEEYRKLVMSNTRPALLGDFLSTRPSYQRMELRSQASFRQGVSDSVDTWILNGAHGTVHDILVSIYQDKLIAAFELVKKHEGEADKTGYLPRRIDEWTEANPGIILEWDTLQALWDGIGDTSALDALARLDAGMAHPPASSPRPDS